MSREAWVGWGVVERSAISWGRDICLPSFLCLLDHRAYFLPFSVLKRQLHSRKNLDTSFYFTKYTEARVLLTKYIHAKKLHSCFELVCTFRNCSNSKINISEGFLLSPVNYRGNRYLKVALLCHQTLSSTPTRNTYNDSIYINMYSIFKFYFHIGFFNILNIAHKLWESLSSWRRIYWFSYVKSFLYYFLILSGSCQGLEYITWSEKKVSF